MYGASVLLNLDRRTPIKSRAGVHQIKTRKTEFCAISAYMYSLQLLNKVAVPRFSCVIIDVWMHAGSWESTREAFE